MPSYPSISSTESLLWSYESINRTQKEEEEEEEETCLTEEQAMSKRVLKSLKESNKVQGKGKNQQEVDQ